MSLFFNDEISSIPCAKCGGSVIEFSVPNDVWNKVVRPTGRETSNEYICVNCWFNALRVALGIESVEQCLHPTPPSALVNHCKPVNGVHAPFCTGHESAGG